MEEAVPFNHIVKLFRSTTTTQVSRHRRATQGATNLSHREALRRVLLGVPQGQHGRKSMVPRKHVAQAGKAQQSSLRGRRCRRKGERDISQKGREGYRSYSRCGTARARSGSSAMFALLYSIKVHGKSRRSHTLMASRVFWRVRFSSVSPGQCHTGSLAH